LMIKSTFFGVVTGLFFEVVDRGQYDSTELTNSRFESS